MDTLSDPLFIDLGCVWWCFCWRPGVKSRPCLDEFIACDQWKMADHFLTFYAAANLNEYVTTDDICKYSKMSSISAI